MDDSYLELFVPSRTFHRVDYSYHLSLSLFIIITPMSEHFCREKLFTMKVLA